MLGLAAGMVGLGPSDASLEGGAASGPAAVGEAAGELEQAARTPSKEVAISLRNTAPAPKLDGGSLAATFSTDRLRACCKAHPGGSRPGQRRRRAGSAHGQETIGGAAPIRRSRRLQDRPRGRARAVRIAGAGLSRPGQEHASAARHGDAAPPRGCGAGTDVTDQQPPEPTEEPPDRDRDRPPEQPQPERDDRVIELPAPADQAGEYRFG